MSRSTKAAKARQINTARGLLQRGIELSEAVRHLSRRFDLSERQAYRYLEEASQLDRPIEIPEATVSVTLKLLLGQVGGRGFTPDTVLIHVNRARCGLVGYQFRHASAFFFGSARVA